jgi:hypothetical protein
MEKFFKGDLSLEDLSFHIKLVRGTFWGPGKLPDNKDFRLVVASPSYDPLVCFPKFYYALNGAYPKASIYVVGPSWVYAKPLRGTRNLVFLEGLRKDIPLRNNFADYLLLQGFPTSSPATDTINECTRVLKIRFGMPFHRITLNIDRKGRAAQHQLSGIRA